MVGFIAQVSAGRPGELAVGGDGAGVGHACQGEVNGVRQHRGEQRQLRAGTAAQLFRLDPEHQSPPRVS